MTTVDVVVTTYQRPDALKVCLDSIIDQSRRPDRVIVVARADDVNSRAVLSDYHDYDLLVVEPDGPGLIPAIYAGLRAVRSDVGLVFDDDVAVSDDSTVAKYIAIFDNDPNVGAVGGPNRVIGRAHEIATTVGTLSRSGRLRGNFYKTYQGRATPVQHLQGCNMGFRSPMPVVDLGLKGDGSFYELDLCWQVRRRGQLVWFDPALCVDHYQVERANDTRSWTDRVSVSNAAYNLARVLGRNEGSSSRRIAFLFQSVVIGQRKVWGVASAGYAVARRELSFTAALAIVIASTHAKVRGWVSASRIPSTRA